ncbi:MAG: hypothetical protein HY051_02200 [Candidatus Aenigmarchaeota archaeon]|nr:hypothetical protein [Candidatus Aenigmarchaeota archaeon]
MKKIVPDYEAAPTLGRHYPTGVWPVNYERAEQILDRLIQIERRQGTADERYRMRDKLKKKLKNLRVDLEELR